MFKKCLCLLLIVFICMIGTASADTITLRPNGAGAVTQLSVYPSGSNYAAVDESVADDESTYVYWDSPSSNRLDLYTLQNATVNGSINSVTIYSRNWGHTSSHITYKLRTYSTTYSAGGDGSLTFAWTTVAGTPQTVNPSTSAAWTWQEINDLEVGVDIFRGSSAEARSTQVYAVIDYDPFVPPTPTNLDYTEGYYFVNYTWDAGAGFISDSYNVSLNDIWTNGSTNTYYNSTSGINGWHNISVYAYNSTGDGTVGLLSASSLDGNVQLPPELYTPTDDSTISESFPPVSHSVSFTWQDTLDSYKFQLARDQDFTLIVNEEFISTNTTTTSLTEDEYYWRVANYNPTDGTTSNYSEIYNFTLELTSPPILGTVIDGVVYEVTDVGDVAVDEAIVYIYNSTWSGQMITGTNGYYQFTDLANDTYSIQATKQGYVDSSVTLVTTTFNETITNNILIERRTGAGDQYDFHYVEYTVKDIWGTVYTDVDVEVFENGDVVSIFTAVTGTDGAATFILNRDQEYRLEFTNATQGIDEEIIHYPKEDHYNVYVITQTIEPDEQYSSEELETTISKQTINNTHAYINVTYLDNLAETTGLTIYLNQSATDDLFNQTVIDSYSGAANNTNVSFVVENYAGQTYFVNIDITHTTFGDVERTYAVSFDGMADAHGFSQVYIWLAIGGIMFSGMIFKATNARQGSFVVCVVAWVFIILGWFDNLGDKGVLAITAGVTLATILSIAAIMAKGEKEG